MNIQLAKIADIQNTTIQITGSKSETNRVLILQGLNPEITIDNISNSDDAAVMQEGLASDQTLIDIHHAGTTMRFLTAYYAIREGRETLLTGSPRMQERPIKILVDALRDLGCEITYEKEEGYPPIRIQGKYPEHHKVTLQANVSSQYISALMLIGSSLPQGIEITLDGKITSVPYIKMTLSLLKDVGITGTFEGNVITIAPQKDKKQKTIVIESDWSSASYYYSIVALAQEGSVTIGSYKKKSYQGDSVLSTIYKSLGVHTSFEDQTITLTKTGSIAETNLQGLDLSNAPDIAQTIAVTCFGLGIGCHLTGLHTLKIKETDRLEALKVEIEKLGGQVTITADTLTLVPSTTIKANVAIDTYNDHRMAMAFAPLALRTAIRINNADVVSKSYPDFWSDLEKLGFTYTAF